MTHPPHPQMAAILASLRAAPPPDPQSLPIAEARIANAEAARAWNLMRPEMPARELAVAGVPCRLLLPPGRERGIVLFLHGGGWTFGSPDSHDRFARLVAIHARSAVLVPDYRLAPEHPCPAAIDDALAVCAALAAIPEAAGPLVLCGDSAGATIALATALAHPARRPAALSLLYGCFAPQFDTGSHRRLGDGIYGLTTDRMRWYWQNWLGTAHDPRAIPLDADLAGLPRTHLLAAGLDPLLDDTIALASRLAIAGIPVRLEIIPGVVHGFLQMSAYLDPALAAIQRIAAEIRAAMDQHEDTP